MSGATLGFDALKYISLTGAHGSGKTFSSLSMLGAETEADGPKKILVLDTEYSTTTYSHLFNMDVIDWWDIVDGVEPKDQWEKMTEAILTALKGGKYAQFGIDTIEPPQGAAYEYVRARPSKYGKSKGQYDKMTALLTADVKLELFNFLAKLAKHVELVTLVCHERKVWKNDRPTKNSKPVGLSPFQQVSHLTVCLDREIKPGKPRVDDYPKGIVLKDRCIARDDKGVPHPVFPPTFPRFSGDAIREYLAKPASWDKLKKAEQAVDPAPSEAEVLDRKRELLEMEERIQQQAQANAATSVDPLAPKPAPVKEEKPAALANPEKAVSSDRISPEVATELIVLAKRIDAVKPGFWDTIREKLPKYTIGETPEWGDIRVANLDKVRGAIHKKLDALGISKDPN